MAAKGYETVRQCFSHERWAKAWKQVIEEIRDERTGNCEHDTEIFGKYFLSEEINEAEKRTRSTGNGCCDCRSGYTELRERAVSEYKEEVHHNIDQKSYRRDHR